MSALAEITSAFLPLVSARSRQRRLPRGEELRGLKGSRQDDGAHADVSDQVSTRVVVSGGNHLQHLARHAGVPQLVGEFEGDGDGLGRRLQDHRVTSRQRRQHAAGGDGVGEVPRRHHEDDAGRR